MAEGEGSPPRRRPWARQGRQASRHLCAKIHPIPAHPPLIQQSRARLVFHAGAWCKANSGPMAIAGSEAVFPWHRIGQLLFDVVLGLRTVGQACVVGNGGRPVDQIVHTAEVVERVDVPLLDAFPYRVHSLFEARGDPAFLRMACIIPQCCASSSTWALNASPDTSLGSIGERCPDLSPMIWASTM